MELHGDVNCNETQALMIEFSLKTEIRYNERTLCSRKRSDLNFATVQNWEPILREQETTPPPPPAYTRALTHTRVLPPTLVPPPPPPPPPPPLPAPHYSSELGRPTCRVQLSLDSGSFPLGVFGEHRTPMCAAVPVGRWNRAVRLARNHHVQPSPRPVLLVSVWTLLQETLAVHGPAWVSDLRDEQAAAGAHRGEPSRRVPLRQRRGGSAGFGGGSRADLHGRRKLSVRKCACDAKVPNIPEVKVNRLLRFKSHHPLKWGLKNHI